MSMENLIVWQTDGIPRISEINERCQDSGHSVTFDPSIELSGHTGFLPARFEEHETGFEFYFLSKQNPDLMALDPFFEDSQGVMAVTGGDFRENLVALIFLQAFSQLTEGAYLGLSFDIMKNSADTPAYLQSEIDAMQVEIEREARNVSKRLERQKASSEMDGSPAPDPEETEAAKSRSGFWSRLFGRGK